MKKRHLGDFIRQAREQQGITQEELAERVGKDQRSISEYEHGKRRLSAVDLPAFARALGVSLLYFFGDEVNDDDFQAELLEYFDKLKTPESKKSAIELMRVFTEAMNKYTTET